MHQQQRTAPGWNYWLGLTIAAQLLGCSAGTRGLDPQSLDAGASVFRDAGGDAGARPPDAGAAPPDAGAVTPDAGAPQPDTGVPPGDLLIVSDEFNVAVLDLSDPSAPIALEDEAGNQDEPLPLYSLAYDRRGYLYEGRLGSIWVFRLLGNRFNYVGSFEPPIPDDAPTPNVLALAIEDGRLYAALGNAGIEVFDLADPEAPTLLTQIRPFRAMNDLVLLPGNRLATYDHWDSALYTYDLSDVRNPRVEAVRITDWVDSGSQAMAALGGIVAINVLYAPPGSAPLSGIFFFDASDPADPRSLRSSGDSNIAEGHDVSLYSTQGRTYGYFAGGAQGLVIAEATDVPEAPRATLALPYVSDSEIVGDHLYVGTASDKLAVYSLTEGTPLAPALKTELSLPVSTVRLLAVKR